MIDPIARRVTRALTTEEQERLRHQRAKIAAEADLTTRDRLRDEARTEPTLSGELRRAVHASPLTLSVLADRTGIPPQLLDEFLTGERTLRSDVLDRLASALGFVLQSK